MTFNKMFHTNVILNMIGRYASTDCVIYSQTNGTETTRFCSVQYSFCQQMWLYFCLVFFYDFKLDLCTMYVNGFDVALDEFYVEFDVLFSSRILGKLHAFFFLSNVQHFLARMDLDSLKLARIPDFVRRIVPVLI